jgi:hypothetical protein
LDESHSAHSAPTVCRAQRDHFVPLTSKARAYVVRQLLKSTGDSPFEFSATSVDGSMTESTCLEAVPRARVAASV